MPDPEEQRRRHLLLRTPPSKESYTSPRKGRDRTFQLVLRDREPHARALKEQLEAAAELGRQQSLARPETARRGEFGIYLEFESEPEFELKFESLDLTRSKIELENVRESGGTTLATVYVPDGKLHIFLSELERYRSEIDRRSNAPKNQKLFANIAAIRLASLKAFWTDSEDFDNIPNNESRWWETWLRKEIHATAEDAIYQTFLEVAREQSIDIKDQRIDFPERTVLIVKATKDQLTNSALLLNCLAELKAPQETTETFTRMPSSEQREWVEELASRTTAAPEDSPTICLLDHGVNNGHPLLSQSLANSDLHAYNPAWGPNDTDIQGHGTGMAGLSLFGDLFDVLNSTSPVFLQHRLESVKMIERGHAHPPDLYGAVTEECVARVEISAPNRQRSFCMTVTTKDGRQRGLPSSWSAAVDQLADATDDPNAPKRLLSISSGNLELSQFSDYPSVNRIEQIHDPGQSWNAITVGGFTDKHFVDQITHPGWQPIAVQGSLSPSSTTSCAWNTSWPIKPEIVMEAGNAAKQSSTDDIDYIDSLQLLTTGKTPLTRLFSVTGDTSAATALASRYIAIIQSNYRDFWPESLRGLMINSADWTPAMLSGISGINFASASRLVKLDLMRQYGYGMPNLEKALWSAGNALTLIAQSSIRPFKKDGNEVKTNETNLHDLPWPREVLENLGETPVELRITLSYFIEPNPTQRKYIRQFMYQSHGLRFDLKGPTESIDEFRRRINKEAIEDDDQQAGGRSPIRWVIGPDVRNRGSIISDRWQGTAAELAAMNVIAVYPISGWWKNRKKLAKWDSEARYSLIVTIRTEAQEVDIYTPVLNSAEIIS